MTDKELKEKILAEIERRIKAYNLEADIASAEDAIGEKVAQGKYDVCIKLLDFINSIEEPVNGLWHDTSETPSIFGTYLLVHKGGWCVARYYGKDVPTGNTTGWVEISQNIFVEHPQKWLDLRDILPNTK